MAFGPEKEGEGRSRPVTGCGEAKGEERELGLRAKNERGGFYFFSKSFSFLILKPNSNMNQIEFKYYFEYTFD